MTTITAARPRCQWCTNSDAVRRGALVRKLHPGEPDEVLAGADALMYLAERCGCGRGARPEVAQVLPREGSWDLRAGMHVWVQLKRKAGTKRTAGRIECCYVDGTVDVHFPDLDETRNVPADEWLAARRRA